ncbi:MAG: Si-specific NAD(P)(+) transhydrogenase [Balneolaceae bacterium]|nr:MAG: Si-specific NAD(P)(+) transhydrogenase [Balneolaceae bacterium]
MKFDYDVIIIGSGPAGFSCAMQSTKFGKKVLIVEASDHELGGTWISTGTVPSKALRAAAKLIHSFHSQFGDETGRKPFERFRMEDIMKYKTPILENKTRQFVDDIIKNKVNTARGWGRILDANHVEVTDQVGKKVTYSAEFVLISTGSRPETPKQFTVDHKTVLDYTSILKLTHIPRRLVIIGGGIIALEFATTFSALGTRVTILNDKDQLLSFLDHEIKESLDKTLKKRTIQIINNSSILHITENDLRNCNEVFFKTTDEDRVQVTETDHVLYVGTKIPNTEKLGLDSIGVKLDEKGHVIVDKMYQSSVPGIYAAGDVIGQPSLASASFLQGRLTASHMFGGSGDASTGSRDLPYGIYSIPEISGIGLTEEQATELGIDVTVGRAYLSSLTRAYLNHETDGVLKLVFRSDNLKLVGVHIISEQASDLIHLGQAVMAFEGNIKYFIERVLNYPTYSEAYKVAAFNGLNRLHKAGEKYRNLLDKE